MSKEELLQVLADQQEEFLSEKFDSTIARAEEKSVNLESSLAQVVIGVRRSGKSTLCRKVLRESNVRAAYVNFEDERLAEMERTDLNTMLSALYVLYGEFEYLLLDEIQNVEGWPLFVNRLLRQGMHLLVTGSNAKLLSNELTTHLTGRHHKIEIYPFSFSEYAKAKNIDLSALTTKGQALAQKGLNEYLMQGGFPEVLKERDSQDYINGLLNAIIRQDITQRFGVRYPEVLQRLATYLMDNFAQEYNAKFIAQNFGVSDHTIDTYCHYLQEAFLLFSVHKFSYKSSERIKGEKMYVVDNAFVSNRPNTFLMQNLGWRLENAVLVELRHQAGKQYADVFYYRDRTFEVDFVVAKGGVVDALYQVCYEMGNEKTRKREVNGLLLGAKKFQCDNLTIITSSQDETIESDGKTIKVVSAVHWLGGSVSAF